MKINKLFSTLLIIFLIKGFNLAYCQSADLKPCIIFPSEIKWDAPLPNGIQTSVLAGDPAKEGIYTMLYKIPLNVKLAPHFHCENRTVFVLSGTFYYNYGTKFDESKLNEMPAGTFFTEPSHQPHFAWAKAGEVILEVTGWGPTCTTLIDTTLYK